MINGLLFACNPSRISRQELLAVFSVALTPESVSTTKPLRVMDETEPVSLCSLSFFFFSVQLRLVPALASQRGGADTRLGQVMWDLYGQCGQSSTGVGFLRVLQFLLSLIPPIAPHELSLNPHQETKLTIPHHQSHSESVT
jgi:hypothetical protein